MSLLGSRLQTQLAADILLRLKSQFPKPTLQSAESSAFDVSQTNLANALAQAIGPDVVTEMLNASVAVVGVQTGSGTTTGTVT